MTPQDFIAKRRRSRGQESAGAQEWFIDLCRVVEHGPPGEVDSRQVWYTFERTVRESSGRHGDQRPDLWLWTAVVEEPDGRRWADFEVGDRSENIFQRRYARRPGSDLHRSDAYAVYGSWPPPGRYVAGKSGAVNWNEGP